ncbi:MULTISPECIES: hypothetical protein [Microbacterium]|uniref:Uncharacterized protein n=1 Tax=Microbacterium maritypicum MF109 TaxID=1333857 RepID=T5K628_MICMQ|nr:MULTISPECIES: hypothetical protein [Microbacterium]EQM75919.1 hypothetical protein L687_18585 [Microbacterium maritypicum MF109]
MPTTIRRHGAAGSIAPDLVLAGHVTENEARSIVHEIPGSQDVVVTLRPAGPATGMMRMLFMDQAAAEAARLFHLTAHAFTVETDMPFLPAAYVPRGNIRKAQQDAVARWVLEVPYQEVRV